MGNEAAEELKTLLMRDPLRTIAVAESLTAGHLQALIASVSGASAYFLGGLTAYNLEQKVRQLGVPRDVAEPVNCVSEEVAARMAMEAGKRFGSDIALATSGYAEPDPARGVMEAFAWTAIALRRGGAAGGWSVIAERVECPNAGRVEVQQFVANFVLARLVGVLKDGLG